MDLQSTLQDSALQLKNVPRTLVAVANVVQKIMKTLYDVHFPDAENRRPGRNPECPDSDILAIGWLLEYITEDSENAGYPRLKSALKTVFGSLPERSRFNRRRRNLSGASEVLRRALADLLPQTEVFIVDSFPIPICDFKRAKTSRSDLKWADASGTLATYGHCATKSLGTFLGFRGHLITTGTGVPVDFAIAAADIDDREVLPLLSQVSDPSWGQRVYFGFPPRGVIGNRKHLFTPDAAKQSEASISRDFQETPSPGAQTH